MQFTDSHCHLDDKAFQAQLSTLLRQCAELAINRIIVPSIAPNNFDNVLTLAKKHHKNPIEIFPCLGIHPWFLQDLNDTHLELLTEKVIQAKNDIIAIGEIGIDGAIIKRSDDPDKELVKQQHFFDFQLNLAKQQDLPVIIHHRQSHDKIMPFLRRHQLNKAGIIHGFSGSYQQATDYINLGYKLGVGSTITYSRAKKTINTFKRLPLESLVLETDAPSMPLSQEVIAKEALSNSELDKLKKIEFAKSTASTPVNSPANSPVNIINIFEVLSTMRAESPEQIANQLELNIEQIFFN
ncbi:TatD-related deoxyribonuclease [Colwellia psychrerythraea]|uniref:TatD-related deoxyribonuclease n=2 Tax=Colwellia psychrerythraea TaxID=28229 RepID=A0A099KFG6_COLPS|nr:TatD-related deoxyribonuclease [Colwellia psychrerythraea]